MKPTCLFPFCMALVVSAAQGGESPISPPDFNRDIRPILSDKCYACHGPDASHREADLRLDEETSAKQDRGGYAVIVTGNSERSELLRRITTAASSERMPPIDSGKTLTSDEIDLLRRWIDAGARWSQHWAYEAPQHWPSPTVKNSHWPANFVDQFILARLEHEGLAPSPEADRVTLARRLYFDLTGLPPSPKDVAAFVADDRPDAYERLVDRLLASPAYGERMAIAWLDLVRYADTVGYHGDQEHHISPYRDWVIDAFNENVPFDRFTQEQLAGDLLPNAGVDQKIASGYNRLLQTSHEGGVQPKEYLAIYGADHVRNVSAVWMGATLGCAQCHDHKFDPYTAKDFYAMQAFFADIDEAQHLTKGSDTSPTVRHPEITVLTRLERLRRDLAQGEIDQARRLLAQCEPSDTQTRAKLENQIRIAEVQRDAIEASARRTMITVSIEPRTIRILPRGNWLDESGPIVEPAIPEFLGKLDTGDRRATRLDLANWLTDAKNGAGLLTARVFVNRWWAIFFGEGLSRSLEDFGGQGEPPSHPELLDRLAIEFVDTGWNIKYLVRLIVTSNTYRQSSIVSPNLEEHDPENRLLARQSRWRLPAELVRDNALAVSGLLVHEIGGPSTRPYQPDGYYRYLNFPPRKYHADKDKHQWRRGVYMHWQRTYLHPMLKAFDAPSREECAAQRPRSNTPLAALVLLNDPTFVEAARALATRVLREGGSSDAVRVNLAYQYALSRPPDKYERSSLLQLLETERELYRKDPAAAEQVLTVGYAPTPPAIDRSEIAAWTSVCRVLLNLSEFVTRN